MTGRGGEALYTPELLALAVSLSDWPLRDDLELRGEARSRSCGSIVSFAATLDGEGRIAALGMQVSACAVGQAAGAIFAQGATGRSVCDVAAALDDLERWLARDGIPPAWPGMAVLAPARVFPGRHGAMLLPWKAALVALCKAEAGR